MKRYREFIKEATEDYGLELIYALSDNHTDDAKQYIDSGANINYQDDDGYTPLMVASLNNNIEIMKLLIRSGAKLNIRNDYGKTFINLLKDKSFLKDYSLQKDIINNDESNILILDEYGLINPKIKDEYSELFKANKWGLI